jgi:hypothetical protein
MSDAILNEGSNNSIPELKSDSRLVVLIGSTEGIKGQSRNLSRFSNVQKIRKGVFIVTSPSSAIETEIQAAQQISFVKTREIPSSKQQSDVLSIDRVFSVVTFSLKNPTAKQKKQIERLVRKSIGIRLRPGVILFPLFRSKEQKRLMKSIDENFLLDSIRLKNRLTGFGVNTFRWSRLRLLNQDDLALVTKHIEGNLTRDLLAIEIKIQALRELNKNPEVPLKKLKRNYTIVSGRFKEIKLKWMQAKKLWFYDAEKKLKRTYNLLINVRREIKEREDLI